MTVVGWSNPQGAQIELKLEFAPAISASAGAIWESAIWDTDKFGAGETWVDITADVRSARTFRGRQRETQRFEAGRATIVLDNRDGDYSPENLAGPYADGVNTGIRPWRPIRLSAYLPDTFTWYSLWYGYAISFVEEYDLSSTDSTVTIECVDELGRIAGFDVPEIDPPLPGDSAPWARIQLLLEEAGITAARDFSFDTSITVQETAGNVNCLEEIQSVCDSTGGAFYANGAGTLIHESIYHRLTDYWSTVATVTIDDLFQPCYDQITLSYDGDLVVNSAVYTCAGGTPQTFTDAASQALYGRRQDTASGLQCNDDAQAAALAAWTVLKGRNAELRFESMRLNLRASSGGGIWYGQWLGVALDISRRVELIRRAPGGYTITRQVFIEGIEHDITPETWSTTFALGSATAYDELADPRWDSGEWDGAKWLY